MRYSYRSRCAARNGKGDTEGSMTENSKKIGIVYGMENTFPSALVDCINARQVPGVTAEHLRIGAIKMAEPSGYSVIIDRISHDIPFYRAYLKKCGAGRNDRDQ